jgi:hypothetical protein
MREKNKKIIKSLKGKFKKEGYYRLKPRNQVPALIKLSDFLTILDLLKLIANNLLDNPKETPPQLKLP